MNEIKEYKEEIAVLPEYKNINNNFQEALKIIDDIVLKNYISELKDLEVIPLGKNEIESNVRDNVRFFKINKMVYEKDEYATHKFTSVFNALSSSDSSVFIMIDSDGEKTDFYMGIRSSDSERTTNSLKDILKKSMSGQFPGIKIEDYLEDEMYDVLNKIKSNSIAAVSSVANTRTDESYDNKSFIQGLEKLALSMQGERYTGIIIANSTNRNQLTEIRRNYEKIYTQLAPFANSQVSYANNTSLNSSESFTKGSTKGTSYTENRSSTHSSSKSQSESIANSESKESAASKTVKGLSSAVGIAGAALAGATGGVSLAIGGVVSGGLGLLGTAIQKTETQGTTSSDSFSESNSSTNGETFGENRSENEGFTNTKGLTNGNSQSIALTIQDKSIGNILDRIDTQLDRLKEFESLGMWECAAYFLSDNPYGAEIAAATYKSLMRGENSGVEVSSINSWGKADNTKKELIKDYVTNFIHPVFQYNNNAENIEVTPCSLVSSNELSLHMGLPRKSVNGFPVIEHADFGKEVTRYNNSKITHSINLGNVFNMGSECTNRVELNRNSLSMHTFITGSTGSGKSNTVYEILDQLSNVGIKFLIIEPAKGEYKNIFGNRKSVTVLGTNNAQADLLRINPFKFPSNIHVLEHVDRLIEIFNVCWPMYAAMPAVLKEAVLQAYEACGWDMDNSKNYYSEKLFPTFEDLQRELVSVINDSAYSDELKSNYIGSLVTRVKSLTNGLNGQIFSSNEIDNEVLFDENIIIDLSRVGSSETKSLIMGILVMRLNEHRMNFSNGMNEPLKHVTVLEEAHNILKRTSTEQSSEGSNVAGKSVEMLSNAIAEMRTYGEGFIIADQSPSSVDISAIKNTNTKIIMRLPDETDRRLSGKSAALKDEQLDEIAKLPKGVAVVYQNDWLEPVLCKVRKFNHEKEIYKYDETAKKFIDNRKNINTEVLKLLLKGRVLEKVEADIDKIKILLESSNISTKNKISIHLLLEEYSNSNELGIWNDEHFDVISELVTELIGCKSKIDNIAKNVNSFDSLTKNIFNIIDFNTVSVSEEMKLAICQCLLKNYSMENEENFEIYAAWRKQACDGVM